MAPTGVAADNIGGVTYHSAIPVPRDAKKVEKIRIGRERLDAFRDEFNGVTHLIFDEMSMIHRPSLSRRDRRGFEAARSQTGTPGFWRLQHHPCGRSWSVSACEGHMLL